MSNTEKKSFKEQKAEKKAAKMAARQEKQKLSMQMGIEAERQKLIAKGVPEDQLDLELSRIFYERMPVEKKVQRLEGILAGFMQQASQDMQALYHNHNVLADVAEENARAITKCLVLAGVSEERQGEIIAQVRAELEAERKAAAEKQAEEQAKELADRAAQARETMALSEIGQSMGIDANGSEVADSDEAFALPDGATAFGG